MSFDYENYLAGKLDLYNTDNLIIRVATEELFQRSFDIKANEIYVVIKRLASTISYESKTEPIQITILSEANSEYKARELFERVANNLNWTVEEDPDNSEDLIKQQYALPISMNEFLNVSKDYRSILYVQATLIYLKKVLNVEKVEIDEITDIKPLSLSIAYQMQGNTQQISGNFLSTTEKSIETLVMSMVLPLQDSYYLTATQTMEVNVVEDGQVAYVPSTHNVATDDTTAVITDNKVVFHTLGTKHITYKYYLIDAILLISSGNYSGNKKFNIKIDKLHINRVFKLTGATYSFAPNNVPSLVLGWIA